MNRKKIAASLCFLIAAIFLSGSPVFADPMGTPTLLLPDPGTSGLNEPKVYDTPRPVANGYYLIAHCEGCSPERVTAGPAYTNVTGYLTYGNGNATSIATVYSDPVALETKAYQIARTDGSQENYSYASSQAVTWFVLTGGTGTVDLAADILVQGRVYADFGEGGFASTIYGTSLGVLTGPSDLVQDVVTMAVGKVGDSYPSEINTVDYPSYDANGGVHELNYLIRSLPFTVTFDEPFRLSLVTWLQGRASYNDMGAWGETYSDFYDPGLQGIYFDLGNGQYATLESRGCSISSVSSVPEPATILLYGLGFAGAGVYRRLRKKK